MGWFSFSENSKEIPRLFVKEPALFAKEPKRRRGR